MKWFFSLLIVNGITAALAISNHWEPMHVLLLCFLQAGLIGVIQTGELIFSAANGRVNAQKNSRVRPGQFIFRAIFFFVVLAVFVGMALGQFFTQAPLGVREIIPWSQIIISLCILALHLLVKIFFHTRKNITEEEFTRACLSMYGGALSVVALWAVMQGISGQMLLIIYFVIKFCADALGEFLQEKLWGAQSEPTF